MSLKMDLLTVIPIRVHRATINDRRLYAFVITEKTNSVKKLRNEDETIELFSKTL